MRIIAHTTGPLSLARNGVSCQLARNNGGRQYDCSSSRQSFFARLGASPGSGLNAGCVVNAAGAARRPPILISPAAGAVIDNGCKGTPDGITWDFDWSDVPSVASTTKYHLKVWKNPALPVINKMDITTSSYHHPSAPSDYIINTNLTGWRWMVTCKGARCVGSMESGPLVQSGKNKYRLSIDNAHRGSLHGGLIQTGL